MNTPNFSTLIWCIGVVLASFGLYMVKYQVQELQSESAALASELTKEHETLHIVAAEWAYLNRPERLKKLAEKYLDLQPMHGAQLAEMKDLPYRPQYIASVEGGNAPEVR